MDVELCNYVITLSFFFNCKYERITLQYVFFFFLWILLWFFVAYFCHVCPILYFSISYKKKKLGGFFSRLSLVWIIVIDTWLYTGAKIMIKLFVLHVLCIAFLFNWALKSEICRELMKPLCPHWGQRQLKIEFLFYLQIL